MLVGINLLREGLDLPEVSLVGDPRRRQGRLPARRALADPDHRPRGAQRARQGHHVRRPRDRLDEEGDRRDARAPRDAGGVQHAARHHAQDDREGDPRRWRARAQDDFVDVTKPARKAKEADIPLEELPQIISAMRREMFDLSEALEFEKAAALRDRHQGAGGDPPLDGQPLACQSARRASGGVGERPGERSGRASGTAAARSRRPRSRTGARGATWRRRGSRAGRSRRPPR